MQATQRVPEKIQHRRNNPQGLQIPVIPKVNGRREQFETKWRAKMHECSKGIITMLTEYYGEESELMEEEIK